MMNYNQEENSFTVYADSVNNYQGNKVFIAKTKHGDKLIIEGDIPGFSVQNIDGHQVADLNHENAIVLRKLFPFTAPRAGLTSTCSIGVGDRLGVATAGHIEVFKKYPQVFPVLAQQSIRELNLTQRSYEDVLDCVSFAVFKAGYKSGFGADGDHLKKPEEIEYALSCGYSMITLDCSEYIRGDITDLTADEVQAIYQPDKELEALYMDIDINIAKDISLRFNKDEYMRTVLIYGDAIRYIIEIYKRYIEGKSLDFEISIDETMTPTSPMQHYFVANELVRHGVHFASLAPRFIGEFQKGIDYIGDVERFNSEFIIHHAIAKHFDYKVSVHSGSDKFKIFSSVGKLTGGVFHLKTTGTNWLEAVRLVAMKDPELYRRLHAFALENFNEASKYYHVSADIHNIPNVDSLLDSELPNLMNMVDARQLLHITYGLILTAKNNDGNSRFRDDFYALLDRYADDYANLLKKHIGKHVKTLFSEF